MPVLLLDTCAVVWIVRNEPLQEPAASVLAELHPDEGQLAVSPMTAWEIAMFAAKRRLALSLSPTIWFDRICATPGLSLAEMPPSVLIASCTLPGSPPADPVDRILAATARAFGYILVTRDRRLLDYGSEGHIQVMRC